MRPHFRRSAGSWLCETWETTARGSLGRHVCGDGATIEAAWLDWITQAALVYGLVVRVERRALRRIERSLPSLRTA